MIGRPPTALAGNVRPLKLVLIGEPDVEIRLSRPVTARGIYGLRRTSTIVHLQVDDPARFVESTRGPGPTS